MPLRVLDQFMSTTHIYKVSRELVDILQPLVGNTEHHVANSQELVKEMTKIRVEEGESFVSYNLVSLFIKTRIKEVITYFRFGG